VSRRLFVWGNNDKWQLGMENGLGNPTEDGTQNNSNEEISREIPVPHLLDPDPFVNEDGN
jgi:hypothetical protein